MWLSFGIIAVAVVFYATEWLTIEMVSLAVIVALLVLFQFFPLADGEMVSAALVSGFANPALLTVLALLVIGQGLHQSGALADLSFKMQRGAKMGPKLVWFAILGAGFVSAFMNNTPVVMIFIPVLSALANRLGIGASRVLMPLSFITILGGMTTLIGSSTNLLVASVARPHLDQPMAFFDFFAPGLILASIGTLYVVFILPKLLHGRTADSEVLSEVAGKQYLAEVTITHEHPYVGAKSVAGLFPAIEGVTIRLVQRGKNDILPPFEDVSLRHNDVISVAGTRAVVTDLLNVSNRIAASGNGQDDQVDAGGDNGDADKNDPLLASIVLAEAAVAPGSRLEGRFLVQTPFQAQTGCQIVGVQRRKRMLRMRLDNIRMQAGDVLLIAGPRGNVQNLSTDRDLLVLGGTMETLPKFDKARASLGIFAITVASAALGFVPILISALAGACAMLAVGCVNINQAARALDKRIVLLVAASIAMANAMEFTGGAVYVANQLLAFVEGASVEIILSTLFLLIAILTNMLSNNATALLFTPIVLALAEKMQLSPTVFIHMVIFAANCSFASPVGYQTNLLVMAPGNYRFKDFMRGGIPLVVVIWFTFTLLLYFYYDINI